MKEYSNMSGLPRLNSDTELFNRHILFGKERLLRHKGGIDDKRTPSEQLPALVSVISLHEKYSMPIDYFIRLFAQSAVLHSCIARNFSPVAGIKKRINDAMKYRFALFSQKKFKPSQSFEAVNTLIKEVLDSVDGLRGWIDSSHGSNKGMNLDKSYEIQAFVQEYERFKEDLYKHLESSQKLLEQLEDVDFKDQELETIQELIQLSLRFLEEEHEIGRIWAQAFFECRSHVSANLHLTYEKINIEENQKPTQLSTHKNSYERFIMFTFSPQKFIIKDFKALAFYFFHEYISHLDAAMYPAQKEDGTSIEYRDLLKYTIPLQLSEGWMIHVADVYFKDNWDKLLSASSSKHRREDIETLVANWIYKLTTPENEYPGYLPEVDWGKVLATDFLYFLRDVLCDGKEERARRLFYRISFDLVTRYPFNGFSHMDFLLALRFYLSGRENQEHLSELINSKCLNGIGSIESINLDNLWFCIRDKVPQVDHLSLDPVEFKQV